MTPVKAPARTPHPRNELSLLQSAEEIACSSAIEPSSHRREKFRAHRWVRPWTVSDADAAGRGFRKVGNALVEIHVPAFDATHHLLPGRDGAGRAGTRADLTRRAEIVGAKTPGRSRKERHVRRNARETNSRTEARADQRAMLAQFSESGGDRRRNQQERAGVGPGYGSASNPAIESSWRGHMRPSCLWRTGRPHRKPPRRCSRPMDLTETFIVVRQREDNHRGCVIA